MRFDGHELAELAPEFLGVQERPMGSNRGPLIDSCNRFVGNAMGSAWCAALACKLANEAGYRMFIRTGSSGAIADWGEHHNAGVSGQDVSPGCIGAVIDPTQSTGHRHTVIAVSGPTAAGWVATVEGNEGDAVRSGERRLEECDWVVPWALEG